jgi:hypothetical protein
MVGSTAETIAAAATVVPSATAFLITAREHTL